MTAQLNVCKNSPKQPKQQWGSPDVGAALQAYAVVVDMVVTVIITGADNNCTIDRVTTTAITCQAVLQLLDVTMAHAALVAAMEDLLALVLFAALPGTKPNSALR